VRFSAKWMEASREITTTLLSGADTRLRTLQLIVDRACQLTRAEHAVVLVPAETELAAEEVEELVVSTAVGPHAQRLLDNGFRWTSRPRAVRSGRARRDRRLLPPPDPGVHDVGEHQALMMAPRTQDAVVGVNCRRPQS